MWAPQPMHSSAPIPRFRFLSTLKILFRVLPAGVLGICRSAHQASLVMEYTHIRMTISSVLSLILASQLVPRQARRKIAAAEVTTILLYVRQVCTACRPRWCARMHTAMVGSALYLSFTFRRLLRPENHFPFFFQECWLIFSYLYE